MQSTACWDSWAKTGLFIFTATVCFVEWKFIQALIEGIDEHKLLLGLVLNFLIAIVLIPSTLFVVQKYVVDAGCLIIVRRRKY